LLKAKNPSPIIPKQPGIDSSSHYYLQRSARFLHKTLTGRTAKSTDSEFSSLILLPNITRTAGVVTLKKRVKMTQDSYEQRKN
jgi:hypothetical protein